MFGLPNGNTMGIIIGLRVKVREPAMLRLLPGSVNTRNIMVVMQIAETNKNLQEVEKTKKQVEQEKSDLQAALEEVEVSAWDVMEKHRAPRKGN